MKGLVNFQISYIYIIIISFLYGPYDDFSAYAIFFVFVERNWITLLLWWEQYTENWKENEEDREQHEHGSMIYETGLARNDTIR